MIVTEGLRCAAIGECMLELSSEPGHSFGKQELSYGGDTLNTAIYMARQGVNIDYITALGDDAWSQEMLAAWQNEGVGTEFIIQLKGRLPGLYAIKTEPNGERDFFYWRKESPARELFDLPDNDSLLSRLLTFDYLYLSGITLSLYSEQTLTRLWAFFADYKARGGSLIFDSNYRPRNWKSAQYARQCFDKIAAYCDILLPTLDDEQLFDAQLTLEQCRQHYIKLGVKELVIKLGSEGCVICSDNGDTYVPTQPVKAIDTTAAGDSFNGTYLAARMKGYSPEDSAKKANQVAGVVVQHCGAIIEKSYQSVLV